MKTNYRKTFLSVAIATLISAPAWSAVDLSGTFSEDSKPQHAQHQAERAQQAQSRAHGARVADAASRARASNNPLYTRTPDQLAGMAVIGSDGESVGNVKSIVMGRNRDKVHAVISSGGILGMGTRETLIPLSELSLFEDDKLKVEFTKDAIAQRPEFNAPDYGVMEADRRISDFSAFEPTRAADARTSQGLGSGSADSRPSSATAMDANPLHRFTPKDLDGMEVIGADRKKIGNVTAIVSRENSDEVLAVISTGGFLGIGSIEILVPLNELKSVGDEQLQAEFNREAVDSQPKYGTPQYANLDKDRPISEFFAGARSKDGEGQRTRDRAKGQLQ